MNTRIEPIRRTSRNAR